MRLGRWIPGLEPSRLSWSAVAAAVGFWWSICFTLVTHFLWSEMFPPVAKWIGLLSAGGCWAAVWILAARSQRAEASGEDPVAPADDIYPELLVHYLRGEWDVLIPKVNRYLRKNSGDTDARLLLAAALRRQNQIREARRQLDFVRQLDTSGKWLLELHREKQFLRQLETQPELTAEQASSTPAEEPAHT